MLLSVGVAYRRKPRSARDRLSCGVTAAERGGRSARSVQLSVRFEARPIRVAPASRCAATGVCDWTRSKPRPTSAVGDRGWAVSADRPTSVEAQDLRAGSRPELREVDPGGDARAFARPPVPDALAAGERPHQPPGHVPDLDGPGCA